jgi:hypothetical protein
VISKRVQVARATAAARLAFSHHRYSMVEIAQIFGLFTKSNRPHREGARKLVAKGCRLLGWTYADLWEGGAS